MWHTNGILIIRTLEPIWLPHWPACKCTISRISIAWASQRSGKSFEVCQGLIVGQLTDFASTDTDGERATVFNSHTHTHTNYARRGRRGGQCTVRCFRYDYYVCCEWSARSRREYNVHWSQPQRQRLSDPPTQRWASRERERGEGRWAGCVSISCALAFHAWEKESESGRAGEPERERANSCGNW